MLVKTRNPLNIGAVARAMSNFGFLKLRVVSPYEQAYREARSAVGGLPVLTQSEDFDSVAEAIADCSLVVGTTAAQNREITQPMRTLSSGATIIRRHLRSGRVAILFGSEKRGLSNEDMSHCHWLMHIPTREEHLSMNLGQAVAVSLYEIGKGLKQESKAKPPSFAEAAELERVSASLLEALTESGYFERSAGKQEQKLRRFVHRLRLTSKDSELLLGMLKQVHWKLHSKDRPPK